MSFGGQVTRFSKDLVHLSSVFFKPILISFWRKMQVISKRRYLLAKPNSITSKKSTIWTTTDFTCSIYILSLWLQNCSERAAISLQYEKFRAWIFGGLQITLKDGYRKNQNSIPGRTNNLSFLFHNVQTHSEARLTTCPIGRPNGGSLPRSTTAEAWS